MPVYLRVRETVKFPSDKAAQRTCLLFSIVGRNGGTFIELKNGNADTKKVSKVSSDNKHDSIKVTLTTEDRNHALGKATIPIELLNSNKKFKVELNIYTRFESEAIFVVEIHYAKDNGSPFKCDKCKPKKELVEFLEKQAIEKMMKAPSSKMPLPAESSSDSESYSKESKSKSDSKEKNNDNGSAEDKKPKVIRPLPISPPSPKLSASPSPVPPRSASDPKLSQWDPNKIIDPEIQRPISELRVPPFKTLLQQASTPLQQKPLFDGCIQTPENMPKLFGM